MEPQKYFDDKVKALQDQLMISSDLAFLLLRKYHWNDSEASQKWLSSPTEVAKSLNISIENQEIPNDYTLLSKELKEDKCPICLEKFPLIQLYCGYIICQNCFIKNITAFIDSENHQSWPNFLYYDQNQKFCNSSCIPSDISKFIKDDQILSQLKKIFLQQEIFNLEKVRLCHNCNLLITEKNNIGYDIAECPECSTKYCLNCFYQGSHLPLFSEEKLNEFKIEKKNELHILFAEQKKWIEREEKLKEYRKNHQDEVISYFNSKIERCIENNRKIEKDEISKISEITKTIETLKQQNTSPSDQISFEKQCYEKVKNEFESIHSKNCEERSNALKKWNELKELFVTSVKSDTDYPLKIQQMINASIEDHQIDFNEIDDYNSPLKQCPRCNFLIYRSGGCFYYCCNNCHYEFCWACLGDFLKDHNNHHVCTHLSINVNNDRFPVLNGIDYDNENDKKFYPIPFDFEKQIVFGRWSQLRRQHQKIIDSNDSLNFIFMKNNDENDVKFLIVQMLSNENGQMNENEKKATKILNEILFVKSVIAWSYPAMFYCNDEIDRKIFEAKIDLLDDEVNSLIDSIKRQKIDKPNEYFTMRIQKLKNYTKSIFNSVQSFLNNN